MSVGIRGGGGLILRKRCVAQRIRSGVGRTEMKGSRARGMLWFCWLHRAISQNGTLQLAGSPPVRIAERVTAICNTMAVDL